MEIEDYLEVASVSTRFTELTRVRIYKGTRAERLTWAEVSGYVEGYPLMRWSGQMNEPLLVLGWGLFPYWELAYDDEESYLAQKLVDRLKAGGIAAGVLEPGAEWRGADDPDGVS